MPDDELLAIYTALRPGRSTRGRSSRRGRSRLDELGAPRNAAFVREASDGLRGRGAAGRWLTGRGAVASPRARRRSSAASCSSQPWPELGLVAADGPVRPRARARRRGRRRHPARRASAAELRRDRPLPRRARHRSRRRGRGDGAPGRARSRGCSSTSTCPATSSSASARGLTPAKLARVVGMLDPVELMFALKKLRARRDPGNQAHVTNLKENPALLAADAAEAARRGFDEIETTVGVARYAPLNALALLVGSQTGRPGRDDPVRGRGAPEPRARDPRARHVRRDALRLRHRARVRGRRRHAVVEGVPRLRLRVARRQGALHVGHRARRR